ncbi:MAG: hypothetical protein GKR94_30785 [Gammaproteobacteria bacterium]|nr:hypothetical protein [Gammaproteobacteria bacterium]
MDLGVDKTVVLHEADNVATSLGALERGIVVNLPDAGLLTVADTIPFGHKLALSDIEAGGDIVKYGQVIGRATRRIERGEWVHTHNVESARARGDIAGVERD